MRNRYVCLMLLSLTTGLSGCAATSTKLGAPASGNLAWNQTSAPPQRTVASTVPTSSPFEPEESASKPVGLAKYFPGLQRTPAEPPRVVARYRPTWFGLRPNPTPATPSQPTTYMTDARAGLNSPGAELSTLPVALEVPSPKSSTDRAVKPANVEQTIDGAGSTPNPAPAEPSKKTSEAVNPVPPAGEPDDSATAVKLMPEVPTVAPLSRPKTIDSEPARSDSAVPTSAAPDDEKTLKAIPRPSNPNLPPGLPEATVPASYVPGLMAQNAVNFKKHSETKVFASPQVAPRPTPQFTPKPTPQAAPKPMVRPTSQSHPVPTSLTRPTPQATASAQSCDEIPGATTWKRPCFRRLVRKVWGLGEYADPPTAAPH